MLAFLARSLFWLQFDLESKHVKSVNALLYSERPCPSLSGLRFRVALGYCIGAESRKKKKKTGSHLGLTITGECR